MANFTCTAGTSIGSFPIQCSASGAPGCFCSPLSNGVGTLNISVPQGTIQGSKVLRPSISSTTVVVPTSTQTVSTPGPPAQSTTNESYSFAVTTGTRIVTATRPNGWVLGYTYCGLNATGCQGNTPTAGFTTAITLNNANDLADVWWHYYAPVINLNESSITFPMTVGFAATRTDTTLQITNSGGPTPAGFPATQLNFVRVSYPATPWITSPANGSTLALAYPIGFGSAPQTIPISVDDTGWPPNTYGPVTLTLTGNSTNQATVQVTMVVSPPICTNAAMVCGKISASEDNTIALGGVPIQIRNNKGTEISSLGPVKTQPDGTYSFDIPHAVLQPGQKYTVNPVVNRTQSADPISRTINNLPPLGVSGQDFHIRGFPAMIKVTGKTGTFVLLKAGSAYAAGPTPPPITAGSSTGDYYSGVIGTDGSVQVPVAGGYTYWRTCWTPQLGGGFHRSSDDVQISNVIIRPTDAPTTVACPQ